MAALVLVADCVADADVPLDAADLDVPLDPADVGVPLDPADVGVPLDAAVEAAVDAGTLPLPELTTTMSIGQEHAESDKHHIPALHS
jgi:hypothetical protein